MRNGDIVAYISTDGKRHSDAEVLDIPGAGPSLFKRLTLRVPSLTPQERREGQPEPEAPTFEDVPHEKDAEQGEAFWLLPGERRSRSPEDEPLVVTDAVLAREVAEHAAPAFPHVTEAAPPRDMPEE